MTQLGFRQLPLARWTATPLYVMEFSQSRTTAAAHGPASEGDRAAGGRSIPTNPKLDYGGRETFVVDSVEDASGDTQAQ